MTTESNDREWTEHQQDHAREHRVAEDTARRLERQVDETAKRIEIGVQAALQAVSETAKVHSEAHNREHLAHERIHSVEKIQVDKAEEAMNKRLETMNEFRASLADAQARFISREVYDAFVKEREQRLRALEEKITNLEKSQVSEEAVSNLRDENRRQRNGFLIAAALLGLGVVVNLIVNLVQQGPV